MTFAHRRSPSLPPRACVRSIGLSGVSVSCSLRKSREVLWTRPVRIKERRNCDEISIKTDLVSTTLLTPEYASARATIHHCSNPRLAAATTPALD